MTAQSSRSTLQSVANGLRLALAAVATLSVVACAAETSGGEEEATASSDAIVMPGAPPVRTLPTSTPRLPIGGGSSGVLLPGPGVTPKLPPGAGSSCGVYVMEPGGYVLIARGNCVDGGGSCGWACEDRQGIKHCSRSTTQHIFGC